MKNFLKYLKYWVVFLLLLTLYFFWYTHGGMGHSAPHFHANFALYIDGKRYDFSLDKYSQDIAGCRAWGTLYAKDRVHLHENNPDTIHIHHDGVTWWDFFKNNNILFNETLLVMDDGNIYTNNEKNTLRFILNWEPVSDPYNVLIRTKDRLLINYGTESADELSLWKFLDVSDNAEEYNKKDDPGSCSGGHGAWFFSSLMQNLHKIMWH